jgi:hypothetical protein
MCPPPISPPFPPPPPHLWSPYFQKIQRTIWNIFERRKRLLINTTKMEKTLMKLSSTSVHK